MTTTQPLVGDPATAVWADDVAAKIDALPQGLLDDAALGTNVNLTTLNTYVPASAQVTVTLLTQRRVRIAVTAVLGAATVPSRMYVRAGYNTGASAGTPTLAGPTAATSQTTASYTGSAACEASVVLAAGTYTFYPACARSLGGGSTDVVAANGVAVYDEGAA